MNLNAEDAEVQLVDTTTWERVGDAAPWNEDFGTFDLSPDGTQFAAVRRRCDHAHRRHHRRPPGHDPAADACARGADRLPPRQQRLLVAGIEGSTWTVDTRWQSWVTRACTIAGRNLTHEEWQEYYPDRAYEATCPQWPRDG